jgi:ribosomal protein L37AE/L43A
MQRVGLESVAVEGVWLRRIGDWVEVLVEMNRNWKTIIREHFDGPFSHICEPDGIVNASYLEHDSPAVPATPAPAAPEGAKPTRNQIREQFLNIYPPPHSCLMCGNEGQTAICHEPSGVWICMKCRDENTSLRAEVARLEKERDGLLKAIKAVTWFDWSDNDPDAAAAIDKLRAAEARIRELQESKAEE